MSRRYWIALAAIGLALLLAERAHPQSEGDPSEEAQQSASEEGEEGAPPTASIPVRIVHDQEQDEARRAAEYRAEERETDDLRAQESMRNASWWIVGISIAQTVIILIGTVAVVVTLCLMNRANRLMRSANMAAIRAAQAADKTVEVTRKVGNAQTRAYLSIPSVYVKFPTGEEIEALIKVKESIYPDLRITIENHGPSPAIEVHWTCSVDYTCVKTTEPDKGYKSRSSTRHDVRESKRKNPRAGVVIPPNSASSNEFGVTPSLDDFEIRCLMTPSADAKFIFGVFVQTLHEDVFEEEWVNRYGFSCEIDSDTLGQWQEVRSRPPGLWDRETDDQQ